MITAADFTFSTEMNEKEIELRGRYLSIACDLDYILTELICICFIDKHIYRKTFKILMLERILMGRKLSILEKALHDYNEEYFNKYKRTFNSIKILVENRNLFAHSTITSGEDKNTFIFEYIKDSEIKTKSLKIDTLFKQLGGYETDIFELVELFNLLISEKNYL